MALLESIRVRANGIDEVTAKRALDRSIATLRYAAGDGGPLAALPLQDRIASLATASSALAGQRDFKRAIAAYDHAISLAQEAARHCRLPRNSSRIESIETSHGLPVLGRTLPTAWPKGSKRSPDGRCNSGQQPLR